MRVDLFDFDLPKECIATRPVDPRDSARLLVVAADGECEDHTVHNLPDQLRAGDVLVFNNTRVIPARLRGKRGEASIEVLLHKQETSDSWCVFARPARKLKQGDRLNFAPDFHAEVMQVGEEGERLLRFNASGAELFAQLEQYGEMPLPPYIAREQGADAQDSNDYQTVYAKEQGAVAAPTAGLHFTPELLQRLQERGIGQVFITLHVGAGTFLPVKAEDTDDHRMHSEYGVISPEDAAAINAARAAGGRIVAVGTTSLRLLESAVTADGHIQPWEGETDIFITPGYGFKAVDILMTNFHLPKSTLFMLVSAFSGLETMQAAYAHAIGAGYRFYSYGDGCLLFKA